MVPSAAELLDLPPDVTVPEVADRCRDAALAFLRGAGAWDKPELARWMTRHYRLAASPAATSAEPTDPAAPPASALPRRPSLPPEQVARLTQQAHRWVMGIARGILGSRSDISFTAAAIHGGWIVRCRDARGRTGWQPVDRPDLTLAERAISLVAADYLMRPADWLGALVVCRACGAIDFDAAARTRGICKRHGATVRWASPEAAARAKSALAP